MDRTGGAYYLFGVIRGRSLRGNRGLPAELGDLQRVRYRDLEAVVRPSAYELPSAEPEGVNAHQKVVEAVMRRATVLPAPFGMVFRGRRALVHFLEDQYIVLDEALAFVDGHWELRLHLTPSAAGEPSAALSDLAMHVYTELRRFARAAIPFPREERRLLTAAFLVDRSSWIEFVERSDDLATTNPDLAFDVTGPWPPYDFVRMTA
jgi:hypothetical protein